MAKRLAWVLNFDAELEMVDPVGYRPSTRMLARCEELERRIVPLMERCLQADVIAVHRGQTRRSGPDPTGVRGLAWAWTPTALGWLRAKGVEPMPSPGFAAVCTVNHRAFLARAQSNAGDEWPGLPGEGFFADPTALVSHLQGMPEVGRWLLKRPFGFAGRDRKVLEGAMLLGADHTWVLASMQGYGKGLQVEPWVDIHEEYALHAWLDERGGLSPGSLQVQDVGETGSYLGTRTCESLDQLWIADAMAGVLRGVASAASREGYFGPLGLDAYLWKDSQGVERLRVAGDLNARFSMAWFEGMEEWLREAPFGTP